MTPTQTDKPRNDLCVMKTRLTTSLTLITLLALLQGCAIPFGSRKTSLVRSASPVGTDGLFQGIVESEVECIMKADKPKRVSVVAVDPRTGQILAECSRRRGSERPTDDAFTWVFLPASAYKPFIVAAALEDGYVSEQSVFDCGNGVAMFSGMPLKDHTPHGRLNVAEILQKSSNIGMARIGARMPSYVLEHYASAFGFGKKTGICRHAENHGTIWSAGSDHERGKVVYSIGRGVAVTPIQLAMAYATIANGGLLLKPKDSWNETPITVNRVISEKTSRTLRTMLARVVSMNGTAPQAAVKGVTVGGKTGTSQVILPGGHFSENQYVTLFAGFYPVEKPRVVCVVVVDQAQVPPECNFGGLIAAPIFSKICTQALKEGF